VTWKRFARVLVRKSERALKSAVLDLNSEDYDSAVNRSYYAMFDLARAALLRSGITEDKLPRTHHGLIEVFRRRAVQSGLIDAQLAGELSWSESLRIKADYTALETEPQIAIEAVEKARLFVQAVERAFGLDEHSLGTNYDNDNPKPDDKVSESVTAARTEIHNVPVQSFSLEEERRQARENWLRLRQRAIASDEVIGHARDNARDVDNDNEHSLDADLD
jgi:uncharacterized protein (UPF0332 family)